MAAEQSAQRGRGVVETQVHGNWRMLAPDGELMCLVRARHARWYLARGLARPLATAPTTIQLSFEPQGRGFAGDAFHTTPRSNHCVVCGDHAALTRHHVVPRMYRAHLAPYVKSRSQHDLLLLCAPCHDRYELMADRMKAAIAREYGAPLGHGRRYDRDRGSALKAAAALVRQQQGQFNIPGERRQVLLGRVQAYYGVEAVGDALLLAASSLDPNVRSPDHRSHGERVVADMGVPEVQAFVERWRSHFVSCMGPLHLPRGWRIDRLAGG